MEHLNKIEIRGIVGSVYVKEFGNAKVANLSPNNPILLDYFYTRDGLLPGFWGPS